MLSPLRCLFGYHPSLSYVAHGLVLAVYECTRCHRLVRLPLR
jgi:hypothetical protein